VRSLKYTKAYTVNLIKSFWKDKIAFDKHCSFENQDSGTEKEREKSSMEMFLYTYLQRKHKTQYSLIEVGYNLVDACEKYRWNPSWYVSLSSPLFLSISRNLAFFYFLISKNFTFFLLEVGYNLVDVCEKYRWNPSWYVSLSSPLFLSISKNLTFFYFLVSKNLTFFYFLLGGYT